MSAPEPLRNIVVDAFRGRLPTAATQLPTSEVITLDELLDSEEEPYDWLVPGLIERGDRIMVTGLEGQGKSTLTRQIGAQVAIGVHPFGGDPFDPISVLLVDCENSRRQVRRKADRLRKQPGADLHFVFRPDGIDLTIDEHTAWLEQQIRAVSPALVVIGPIYKMAGGDPKDEQTAKAVSSVLDQLRVLHGFAVLIEAHTPYADSGKSKRPERPYGASLWSRWPEFGIYLAADGHIRHWRGQRDERQWPLKLRRGDDWPWEVDIATETAMPVWDGPTHCMNDVLAFLRDASPNEFSGNQLQSAMQAVGSKFRRDTVMQAAERLAVKHEIEARSGARNSRLFRWLPTTQGVIANTQGDPNDKF